MTSAPPQEIPGLLPRDALTSNQRDQMFALLCRHFEGVTREQFELDLAAKNWVVEIRQGGELLGFSTLLVTDAHWDARPITTIYSGDTIVAREAWGSPRLARTWIGAVNFLRTLFPAQPCHWLLLTSGFRTYRFLPVFWREFHPRFETPIPLRTQRLLVHLAASQYGAAFNAATGIVRFPFPQRLREPLLDMAAGRAADEHVAFFLRRNPGHAMGDELACITEISESNLTAAGERVARSARG